MGKHKKPSLIKRLEFAYKKVAQKIHLDQTDVMDMEVPLNENQNLKLQGCKAVTDRHSGKTMLTDCNIAVTSKKVLSPNNSVAGHQVSVDIEKEDCHT